MDSKQWRPLAHGIAEQFYHRSQKRWPIETFRRWARQGLYEAIVNQEGLRDDEFEIHARRHIRESILDAMRREPEGLESALRCVDADQVKDLLEPWERLIVVLTWGEQLSPEEIGSIVGDTAEEVEAAQASIREQVKALMAAKAAMVEVRS